MSTNFAAPKSYPKPWLDGPSPKQEIKAIILLLHGLNLRPEKMDGWAQVLKDRGALVVRLSLSGHTGDKNDMRTVRADIWHQQMDQALILALAQSRAHHDAPIYALGFSLGGLVALEAQARNIAQPGPIGKMVLIAPAIDVPWYSQAAISLCSMFGQGFMVPARSPKNYRVHSGTSVAAYQALFDLKKSLEDLKYKNANVKTLVLLDRHDELISTAAVKKIVKKNALGLWEINIINNRVARDTYGFRHLLVDKESVGDKLWQDMSAKVIKHFGL